MSKTFQLLEYVTHLHKGQKRQGGEDYINHLTRVADTVKEFGLWEVGLCHDLLEDTPKDLGTFLVDLEILGYTSGEAFGIAATVWELTNQFTDGMNRAKRKQFEAYRLSHCSWAAQTVKYADILDNLKSSGDLQKGFREKYLQELEHKLRLMTDGVKSLRELALLELQKQKQ